MASLVTNSYRNISTFYDQKLDAWSFNYSTELRCVNVSLENYKNFSFHFRYVSSSPCSACAAKIAEVLKARKNVKLSIFAARLFECEEVEIQAGLKALHAAGCKLRVMKPLDFSYTWDTFVENEEQPLNLWEDCKENYEYYHEKLADILQWISKCYFGIFLWHFNCTQEWYI